MQGGKSALASVSEERMIADSLALYHDLFAKHGWVAHSSEPEQDGEAEASG